MSISAKTKSSGIVSVSQMLVSKENSSLVASSLALYCSTGTLSGPHALPDFSFLTHSFISSSVNFAGGDSSGGSDKSTSGSFGIAANLLSRKSAHSWCCCSVVVMGSPLPSSVGWMNLFPVPLDDSYFAHLKTSVAFPAAFAVSISTSTPSTYCL